MASFTPQSMLYAARGPVADGNAYRNRSAEQGYTFSGNPNMPIFNQARQSPAMPPVSGGISSRPMTMQTQAMGTPQLNYLRQLGLMGNQSPLPSGATNAYRQQAAVPQYSDANRQRWAQQQLAQSSGPFHMNNGNFASVVNAYQRQMQGQGTGDRFAGRGIGGYGVQPTFGPAPTKPAMLQRPVIPMFRRG